MKAKTNKNQFKGLRVVVVDNNDDSLKMISLYLKWLGANIKAVTSAKNAINAIKSFQPELIISDLFMPEEDGYWLIKTIREEHNKYIPAIALTIASTN
ncbi:MAG: response regulator, partial [Prochloraceae cyanobacterium]